MDRPPIQLVASTRALCSCEHTMATSISSVASAPAASPSTTKLSSAQNGIHSSTMVFMPLKPKSSRRSRSVVQTVCQASAAADRVPSMAKRQFLNKLLLGALSLPTAGILYPYLLFFVPPDSGSGGAGLVAKDAIGNDILAKDWLKAHPPGDRTLSQGLKGDPTYLVIENDGTLAPYAINAVCTHLGCVVPFNKAENKFICPCHGSQYNNQGRVVRGPAPLSLALAHTDVVDDKVVFTPWVETDFRTGENPWWA